MKRRHGMESDFEINITPIIDCFTVLVTFLLASSSFLAIGVMETATATEGGTASGTPPPVTLILKVNEADQYSLRIQGQLNQEYKIHGDAELTEKLSALRAKWTDVNSIILSADRNVEYKQIIQDRKSVV